MKRTETKPKKIVSARTKLSELRDAVEKSGGSVPRSGTKVSALLEARDKANSGPNITEYATVLAHAVDTFGSRINANVWLNRPNRVFHNKSPLQILTQDPSAVEEELVRIDHGMFV